MLSRFRFWGLGVVLTAAGVAFACGGEERPLDSGSLGNDAGAAGSPDAVGGNANVGASAGTTASAGDANEPLGGSPNAGSANEGGAGAASAPDCPDGYSDWLTSSFAFPDGDVIGTADFPSMPWAATGALKIDTGRLAGTGVAVVSQGVAFPYSGSRFRFRGRFTDSNQKLAVAFDAAKDGSGGVRVEVDSSGHFSLFEEATQVVSSDIPPLETGVDWFVEATLQGNDAAAVLSRTNYASEKGAIDQAKITSSALKTTVVGTKTSATLAANGTSPALDEISYARCGVKPPALTPALIDTFERPDSTTIGKPEVPASANWTNTGAAKIVGGALQTAGDLKAIWIPLKVSTDALRVRTTLRFATGANPYLWADVNYNVTAAEHGSALAGFWVWGGPTDAHLIAEIFGGSAVNGVPTIKPAISATYYVEYNRDGDVAVLVVRTQSYTGPIVSLQSATGISKLDKGGDHLALGDEGGAGTLYDEIRVENYAAP